MKKYILIFVLFLGVAVFAQKELNGYKYMVIPSKFDFQKEANQHGINMLLKYKFQQLGFETYLDTDDLPQELRTNTCLYVYPVLHTKSNMFKTIASVELFNCYNKSLFKTQEGESKSKNIKASYNEAVRKALKSFGDYKLVYEPVKEEVVVNNNGVSSSEADKQLEIERLKAEVAVLKKNKQDVMLEKEKVNTAVSIVEVESYLVAHKKSNGFLLVNSVSKKTEYIIHTTKMKDVFILKDKSGVIYRKNSGWVREYVDKERTVLEFLEIKF